MSIDNITKLAKYGWPGVVIAMIIALITVIVLFLGFMGDHTDQTTNAVTDLTIVVERLNYNLEHKDISKILNSKVVLYGPVRYEEDFKPITAP